MAGFSLPSWWPRRQSGAWCRTALATDPSLQGAVDAIAAQLRGSEEADLALVFASASYASALPRHMPLPDWTALAGAGLGEVVRHHLALAAPARVIAFGSHVSSLLGHDPAKSSPPAQRFFHLDGATPTPVLAAPALSTLLTRPQGKAGLWQALLDWPDA